MLDHVSLYVDDFTHGLHFYDSLLEPIGIQRITTLDSTAGYGTAHNQFLWLTTQGALPPPEQRHLLGVHVAFHLHDHTAIRTWHARALALGAQDNGAPGIRPHYHPDYYAAYIIDVFGWPLEAVCHRPREAEIPFPHRGIAI